MAFGNHVDTNPHHRIASKYLSLNNGLWSNLLRRIEIITTFFILSFLWHSQWFSYEKTNKPPAQSTPPLPKKKQQQQPQALPPKQKNNNNRKISLENKKLKRSPHKKIFPYPKMKEKVSETVKGTACCL